jgi:flagellum-specific ATP synthase
VIDALGRPIDGRGALEPGARAVPLEASPPPAMERARVTKPLRTGVRALDLFTPLCLGQRIGIFAGSGVGKSTLLAMLAGATGFDSVVVALVGERGREVREFLEGAMAPNRARAVIVVSTGDESPMMRRQAPKMALAIAESFRDAGESVLLIVDSVTRYAHAARDVALAAGEPAVARGYPPSVFSDLPRLLERAGPGLDGTGTITGVFSVLVDGDDHNDPVADSIRGTLDGHVVLDRAIAEQGRYPAVHLLGSISRLASEVWTPEQRELVRRLKAMMARFEETRDLRLMGGYRAGEDAELDQAILLVPRIYEALRQEPGMAASEDAFLELAQSLRT